MAESCQFCDRPAKYIAKRLCGAHDQQLRRSGLSLEQFRIALASGESPGLKIKPCSECGTECSGHSLTCSLACATEKRRRIQRESKRREWNRNPEKIRKRQRERRLKDPERYRQMDREKLERKQQQNRTFCLECGTETTGRNIGRKFCCVACRDISYSRKRRTATTDQSMMAVIALSNVSETRSDVSDGGRIKRYRQTCQNCHQEFKSVTGTAKFCSQKCRLESRPAVDAIRHNHTCDVCGSAFKHDKSQAKFCSDTCQKKRRAEDKRRPHVIRIVKCEICESEFNADRKNAKACSTECRAESKRRKSRESMLRPDVQQRQKMNYRTRRRIQISCKICGKDMTNFPNLRTNRYTCSETCRKVALKQKNRRSYAKRRNHTA